MMHRDPLDRFVSLWKHYSRFTKKDLSLTEFVTYVEVHQSNPNMWFYTWKMKDMIEEFNPNGLIGHSNLEQLNSLLGSNISFPRLNATEHEHYMKYYTPELMRKVLDLS